MVWPSEARLDAEPVVRALRPIYVVACDISVPDARLSQPVITELGRDATRVSFDEELLPALPALWYAMHLPKTKFEIIDMSLPAIRANLAESRRHELLLVPARLLEDSDAMALLCGHGQPVTILCPADHLPAARNVSAYAGFLLEPISFERLSQESLDAQWAAIAEAWGRDWPEQVRILPGAPVWTPAISRQGSHLAWKNFHRLLGRERKLPTESDDPYDLAFRQLYARSVAETLTQLEDMGVGENDASAAMKEMLPKVAASIRLPLAISLPGVSPTYERLVRQEFRTPAIDPAPEGSGLVSDADVTDILGLVVGHQAAGDDSLGVVLTDPVPREAFHALADLERHWAAGGAPAKEERIRQRLDGSMAHIWTEELHTLLRSVSQIDAYTNFPIGLLRPPGHTSPLAASMPIAYRPLNPLTRTLQTQIAADNFIDLSAGYTVLVAECINADDPIGGASRAAWSLLGKNEFPSSEVVNVVVEETLSAESVRAAIEAHQPDILILSAHGDYRPEQNVAGLRIGNDFSLGLDLGPMPPLVILSACTSGPRGGGSVAVADLLIRQGAVAVVSTLVPVRVDHNFVFMSRLLLYINESISESEDHASLMDLWHRVQANTVIIDILYGNPRLAEWGHQTSNGVSPIRAFMGGLAAGRIRNSQLYKDAEEILLEIAERQGMRNRVAGWLRTPGYLPESMMYTIVGDPARIRFRPPQLRQRS